MPEEGWRTRLVERLKLFDEAVACWALSGEVDLLLRCVASDLDAYGEFAMNRLLTLPGVGHAPTLDEPGAVAAIQAILRKSLEQRA
jgi:DNA-binding Lrp family transcriptional regulator